MRSVAIQKRCRKFLHVTISHVLSSRRIAAEFAYIFLIRDLNKNAVA
jgi:hypothetical protein